VPVAIAWVELVHGDKFVIESARQLGAHEELHERRISIRLGVFLFVRLEPIQAHERRVLLSVSAKK
jgi:hypothetical protein